MGACISKKTNLESNKITDDPRSKFNLIKTSMHLTTSIVSTPVFSNHVHTKIMLRQPVLQDLKQNKLYVSRMRRNSLES
ncbi:hypothetical protein SteCoe_34314 [Stentor coeruleus]|uniref:Uncharacterized protein n=1 Tax=Stentor coeruleus TaxID=5963 RepID=A0A1R2AUV2_9CILI|nr:hypothetical protein SteCoe_34314 [Stentor coeruleus]